MDLDFDIRFAAAQGEERDYRLPVANAVEAVALAVPELGNPRLEVSASVMTDDHIRALNREWRGKDKPTNVLSFPMLEREELMALAADGPPVPLGDLAFGRETVAREARVARIPAHDHLAHLAIHGLLHLAGYDHETSVADAEAMEALETSILAKMGIADPYGGRDNQE